MLFMPGDRVKYVGSKTFVDGNSTITLNSKIGEVVCKIKGDSDAFVVEFGDDAFVLRGENLRRHYFAPGTEPVQQSRRRHDPDLD